MFTLNNYIYDIKQIPSEWILENYLALPEKLSGQNIRVKSLFNDKDNDPSMFLYFDNYSQRYKFKCWSTGLSGSVIDLFSYLWNIPFRETTLRIKEDYENYLKSGKVVEKREFVNIKWKVASYNCRQWTKADAEYWLQYNIGSKLLEKYNVRPLENYTMLKFVNDIATSNVFKIEKSYIYGYFTSDNELYKIYQPKNPEKKFIKVKNYTQGSEQIENKNFLLITSSLKDIMSIKSIGNLDLDLIAPDAESAKLTPAQIESFKEKYKGIATYMDSDKAGIDSMTYYLQKYNIPYCYINNEKDFSDFVKQSGIKKAAYTFIPKLDKALAKYNELNNFS